MSSLAITGELYYDMHAVYSGQRDVAELLLSRGAHRRTMTPVYFAAAMGEAEELARLLADDPSQIDMPSETSCAEFLLHYICCCCMLVFLPFCFGAGEFMYKATPL